MQVRVEEPKATPIDDPPTHRRLADLIGSTQVTVMREPHELQTRGIVESRKNATIAIRRVEAME